MAAILAHTWPGNGRELQNCIKRAVASAAESTILARDLRLGSDPDTVDGPLTLKQARFLAESKALRQALAIAAGNLSEAARVLDTSRPTLYHLLKQHDIERSEDHTSEHQSLMRTSYAVFLLKKTNHNTQQQ